MKSRYLILLLVCLLLVPSIVAAQNQAVLLDGSSSYGLIPHDPIMNIGTGDFTVEALVKGTSWPIPEPTIFSKGEGSYGTHFFLGIGNTGGIGDGQVRFGAQSWTNPSASVEVHSTFTLSLDEWHHLAGVRQGNTFKIYIDGVFNAEESETIGSMSTNEPVYVGNNRTLTDFFDGCIDEVRFWNVARTDAQIAQHASVQLTGNEQHLIGLWQMNEGAGSSFEDATVYGNDGSFSGNFDWIFANWATDATDWYVLDEQTQALWRNNEPAGTYVAHDESPDNYSLALAEGAEFTGPATYNGAIDFTGPSSVAINNYEIGNGWDAITIDAHFVATVIGDDNTHPLVTRYRWHNAGDPSFLFWVMPTGSLFGQVYLNEPGTDYVWAETAPGRIVPNEPYDVRMTWSNNQTLKLYVNGDLQGESTMIHDGVIRPGDDPLELGAVYYTGYPAEFFTGYIDEVRISDVDRSEVVLVDFLGDEDFEDGNYTENPAWPVVEWPEGVHMASPGHNGSQWCVELHEYQQIGYGLISCPMVVSDDYDIEFWVKPRPQSDHNYFAARISDGPYDENGDWFSIGVDGPQGHLLARWSGIYIGESNIDFPENSWSSVEMNRDPDGSWDVYWNGDFQFTVQDQFGDLVEPWFTLRGQGWYDDGGVYVDDISVNGEVAQPENLVGYWPCDETAGTILHDASGNNLDANLVPSYSFVNGHVNNALLVYNDNGGGGIVADTEILDLTEGVTMDLWIYPEAEVQSFADIIIGKHGDMYDASYRILWGYDNGVPGLFFELTIDGVPVPTRTLDSPSLFEWHHIVATYDGSRAELYVDEELKAFTNVVGTITPSSQPLLIGKHPYQSDRSFNGKLDEIRLYSGQPAAPAAVELTLLPSVIEIPPQGGTLVYAAHLVSNISLHSNNVYYWTNVVLPNGNSYPPNGWLTSQHHVLRPYMDVLIPDLTQNIPGHAPAGEYLFEGHYGFRNGLQVSDSFAFVKTGVAPPGEGIIDWDAGGEFFKPILDERIPSLGDFNLSSAYPNPFNPTTTISVALPETGDLTVTVYNVTGQLVATLANGQTNAGMHSYVFDASDLASGLYFVRATVPGELNAVQKVMLVR